MAVYDDCVRATSNANSAASNATAARQTSSPDVVASRGGTRQMQQSSHHERAERDGSQEASAMLDQPNASGWRPLGGGRADIRGHMDHGHRALVSAVATQRRRSPTYPPQRIYFSALPLEARGLISVYRPA